MKIHPTVVVEGDVIFGRNCEIGPHVCLYGPLTIGENTTIYAGAVIGSAPQHRSKQKQFGVKIDKGSVIREFVTVHAGIQRQTVVGEFAYLMAGSHVAHDCFLEENVTLANSALLAGHCHVMRNANIGLNVSVHQYSVIGSYTMLGMGTVVHSRSKVEPGVVYIGNPSKPLRMNHLSMNRSHVELQELEDERKRFETLRKQMR
jgi:UDP-N-acetylglucosamine acyltransferase